MATATVGGISADQQRHISDLPSVLTVAILAQGTSWAVAVTQAFCVVQCSILVMWWLVFSKSEALSVLTAITFLKEEKVGGPAAASDQHRMTHVSHLHMPR